MCIFSKEAQALETIIASGYNHIAYQNKVSIKEDTVMLMPVPGKNVKFLKLEAEALDSLAKQWIDATDWKPNLMSRSTPGPSYTSEVVGQYTVHYTETPRRALEELEQPVYDWMSLIETRYQGWSFVLVEMKAGQSISNQPWFVNFDPLYEDYLFAPMFDVHGDEEIEEHVFRNHLILVQSKISDTFSYSGGVEEWGGDWDGFEFGYKTGGRTFNGDIASKSPTMMGFWKL